MTVAPTEFPQIEHTAWQVADPPAVAAWYIEHFGFTVSRKMDGGPLTHFLIDASGRMVVEIYNNSKADILDYPSLHPLQLHLGFSVKDTIAERDRLLRAGATVAEDHFVTAAGDEMVMMRDPWGFAIQLINRKNSLLNSTPS